MENRRPTRPARVKVRPVYEEFSPISEWKQEPESQILIVYLPGFKREQIKISTEGTATMRIRGERAIGFNKWSRFQEVYRIPEDCSIRGIHDKFEGGTLTITMPKKTSLAQVGKRESAKTTDAAPRTQETSSHTSPQEIPRVTAYPKSKDDFPPKTTSTIGEAKHETDGKGLEEPTSRKATAEPQSQKGRSETPPVSTSSTNAATVVQKTTSTVGDAKQQTDGKGLEEPTTQKTTAEPKSQKGRSETPPVPTSSTNAATVVQKTTSTVGDAKQQTDGKGLEEPTTQKTTAEPKSQKGRSETPPVPTSSTNAATVVQKTTSTVGDAKQQTDGKGLEEPTTQKTTAEPKSQKGRSETPPVPTSSTNAAMVVQKTTSTVGDAKQQTDGKGLEEPTTQKTTAEPKSQKGRSETPPVPTSSINAATVVQKTTSTIGEAKNQTNGKGLEEPTSQKAAAETTSQKGQGETPPIQPSSTNAATVVQKTISTIGEAKNQTSGKGLEEPISQKAATETTSQKGRGETPPIQPSRTNAAKVFPETIETKERSEGNEKPPESKMPEIASKEKEKGKESMVPENFMKAILDKEKEESEESTTGTHKEKAKAYSDVAKAKQNRGVSFGLLSMGNLKEERQLIVNIGTAILIIVALGAYIF
ncbi:uncharacterized protein LOC130785698 isoform X1 [Actinidia eriantha]|uniref:uncharacterized protein LOC130785698 isoform X1 n=2 Tax=Actinidia eriantha TaxID=165200 RepID=UPI002589ED2F|nr:uncharacterized protein LOC130785698 isoform X1 [Actinidia eriantha]